MLHFYKDLWGPFFILCLKRDHFWEKLSNSEIRFLRKNAQYFVDYLEKNIQKKDYTLQSNSLRESW